MRYRITFLPVFDAKLKIGEDHNTNFSIIANQDGNTVDAKAYIVKQRNILKRMKHGDYGVKKLFKRFSDIPQPGHLVNNQYVVTNVSYTRYNGL